MFKASQIALANNTASAAEAFNQTLNNANKARSQNGDSVSILRRTQLSNNKPAEKIPPLAQRIPQQNFIQRQSTSCAELIQRDENKETEKEPPDKTKLKLQLTGPDFLSMRTPFFERNAMHLWDPNSALGVWRYNFNFFRRFGLDGNWSGKAANLTTPFFINSQLKANNPTWWEITDRDLNTTSLVGSLPIFSFDSDFKNWKPLPFLQKKSLDNISGHKSPFLPQNFVQRKCTDCEEEKAQRKTLTPFIQKKETGNNNIADKAVSNEIYASKGGGSSLPESTKRFMESRFGTDFSDVHIHTDQHATQLSKQLNAQAFTVGNDIYFNEGKYSPESANGKQLLAHELTHTIQQNSGLKKSIQKRDMEFRPTLIAVQLRNAMEGWGTDEDAIYAALAGRTTEQVAQIATAYRTLTGRNLQADLEDELTSSELLNLASYGSHPSNPGERAAAVAVQLRSAMAGWGTDENAIYVALQGRGQAELALIQTAYRNLTSRDLMADLRDELTDDEYNMARGTMGLAPNVFIRNTELGMLSMGNFDFSFRNCQINIAVRVKFQFADDITPAEQNGFKPRFINAVHNKWQHSGYHLMGGPSCPCENVPISVNVVENQFNYHKLVDVEKKYDSQRRPFVAMDINVNLYTDDDTLKHEFGHVLGLYDEYDGGFFENLMFWHQNQPADPGSLMNGVNPDGTANTEAGLRPRFFEHYRRTVNETAPMNCNYMVSA